MLIPITLSIFSLMVIANNIITTGSFIAKDVELTGGLQISIITNEIDINKIQTVLPDAFIRYAGNTLIIQTQKTDEKEVITNLKDIVVFDEKDISVGKVEPVIGEIFWKQAQLAIILAFLFMGLVVFVLFRKIVPSSIVILTAATDIAITVSVISLLDIRLSLPIFAGLLMIIGYSVDTDILLTTRLLKKSGEINEKIKSATKTGLTMTGTTLVVLMSLYLFSQGTVIQQIAVVLIIGLTADIINTWILNSGLLRIWVERKV